MNHKDTFESLYIRKTSKDMFCELYKECNSRKDFYLKDQLLRATLSISNNIAEGYERQTNSEKIRFLYIARGSSGEVRSILLVCKELGIIQEEKIHHYINTINKLSSGIYRLIQSIVKLG